MTLGVVILAAGASSRMGRPKLLLPWAGGTVLGHLILTWRQLGAMQIAVVVAPPNAGRGERRIDSRAEAGALSALDAELQQLGMSRSNRIENPEPDLGMFSSVRCAARWAGWQQGLTHWLLTLGDQPHVERATFQALLQFAAQHSEQVCQPARRGRPRHPVLLPGEIFREIATATAGDLKQFLVERAQQRAWFESSDPGLDFDLDEPGDYERALNLCSRRRE